MTWLFTRRYFEIANEMIIINKNTDFSESLGRQNVSFMIVLFTIMLNSLYGLTYEIQFLAVGFGGPSWMKTLRAFYKLFVLSFNIILMFLLLFSLLVILKIIKSKKELKGNVKILIPHFLVMFSGIISVIALFCQYEIPTNELRDLVQL